MVSRPQLTREDAVDEIEIENEFLLQLGKTLAKWQWVEQSAYNLYFFMMKGADPQIISVNWHHIQSFDTKISLLDGCAFFAVRDQFQDDWKSVHKLLVKAAKARNQIVHSVFGMRHEGGVVTAQLGMSHQDATALTRNRVHKNELRPEFIFDLDRLRKHQREFEVLSQKILWFRGLAFGITAEEQSGAR